MIEYIKVSGLGIPAGAPLRFDPTGDSYLYRGGPVVQLQPRGLASIRFISRRHYGVDPELEDVYSLWSYNGKTLRDIDREKKSRMVSRGICDT